VTQIPIACTLSGPAKSIRAEEWRRFLKQNVSEVIRDEHSARLRLRDGDDVLMEAVDLARREKACCAFFEFRLKVLPDEVWLEIDAPLEATPMIDDLISVA
jgi:hypothetical protein